MELSELTQKLLDFPEQIYAAEKKLEELREIYKVEEIKREYAFAAAFMKNRVKGMNDVQARQQATQDVFETDLAVTKAESAYRKAAADHHYLDNGFTAIRKVANIEEAAIAKLGAPTGA